MACGAGKSDVTKKLGTAAAAPVLRAPGRPSPWRHLDHHPAPAVRAEPRRLEPGAGQARGVLPGFTALPAVRRRSGQLLVGHGADDTAERRTRPWRGSMPG